MKYFYVYILANKLNSVTYIGVTADLIRRVYEHKEKLNSGFTSTYQINKLIYYEIYESPEEAIHREKCLKKWKRVWKLRLINSFNPTWKDLYSELI